MGVLGRRHWYLTAENTNYSLCSDADDEALFLVKTYSENCENCSSDRR